MIRTFFFLLLIFCTSGIAQELNLGLEVRPRFEARNGYKTLLTEAQKPIYFVSQRSRIGIYYRDTSLQVTIRVQNTGIWGESIPMRLKDNNGLSVFEAYGLFYISPELSFKIGRQVLSYDNQRILGEVDWAQQGQSHDAILLSWKLRREQLLEIAAAYNAEADGLYSSPYTLSSYQNLQLVWYHLNLKKSGLSLLFLNTGYNFLQQQTQVHQTQYVQTTGAFYKFSTEAIFGELGAYGQVGTFEDNSVKAWYIGGNINHKISEGWTTGVGFEYLTGNDSSQTSLMTAFTPLLGTNHAFNGHMDYFYVGNHLQSVGLQDLYLKTVYSTSNFNLYLIPHIFWSEERLESTDNYLGTEIDLGVTSNLGKDVEIAAGYSQMFGSRNLEILKGGNMDQIQNWGWVLFKFKPEFLIKN